MLITKVFRIFKGPNFKIDPRIPSSYLISLLFEKIIAGLRFQLTFKTLIIGILASRTKIKCKSKIRFQSNLSIGENCVINALSIEGIQFGKNVSIGKNNIIECTGSLSLIGKGLIVGNNVGMGSNNFFGCAGGINIGDDTIFGNFVSLHSENHNYKSKGLPIRLQGVNRSGIKIGENCWIGAKATILDGAQIGDHCVIAAGALVAKGHYKSYSIIGGVPAKVIKNYKDD